MYDSDREPDGKCPCGIDSFNVAVTRDFDAMNTNIVVRTEWWHDEETRCPKNTR